MSEAGTFYWPEGKRVAVSLSFDDARPSQISEGLPLLQKHGVKGTFYVNLQRAAENVDGWKQAVAQGHEIGNHSVRHPCSANFLWKALNVLENYTLDQIEEELLDANGQNAGPVNLACGLLTASLHLLAWAKTRWQELADYGLTDRLRFLWHWGHARGLNRLV